MESLPQFAYHLRYVLNVVFFSLRKNDDVVEINHRAMVDVLMQDLVHHLKGSWHVASLICQ